MENSKEKCGCKNCCCGSNCECNEVSELATGPIMYEGKAKQLFPTANDDELLVHYKDDATAFNGLKKDKIHNKGIMNNAISSMIFEILNKENIPTHFVKKVNDRDQICKKVTIVPLEVIVRNVAAGSMSKRLGIPEGTALKTPVLEISYKNDELGDPLINDYHAVAIGITTFDELKEIYSLTSKINLILIDLFKELGLKLIDFKIEFGRDKNGKVLLADEISPAPCRLWEIKTNEKMDKDRFRRDMGKVEEAYIEVLKRLSNKK